MRVLALILLLSACGPLPETAALSDMARNIDPIELYVEDSEDSTGMPTGGQGFDRCKYAICNNPDDREKYSNPVPLQTQPLR